MQTWKRTIYCGKVTKEHVKQTVTINGWVARRRDLGGLIFIDVRDHTGIVQLVIDPTTNPQCLEKAQNIKSEYVISATGTVIPRAGSVNKNIATGEIEIQVTDLVIFSTSKPLPFPLDDEENKVSEDLRLTYRYLDLRRKRMYDLLKLRHDVIFEMRSFFNEQNFLEIETPILSKSTPEGARDFLVPCRLQAGTFYALPQSPQIYKQLLMVGGMDRYFQIARCFRDENLRANRQPEFTQLDIEMSFVEENDIQTTCEQLFARLWKKFVHQDLELPLKRYTYDDVFSKYGSDKPDTRFGLEINDLTKLFEAQPVAFLQTIIKNKGNIGGICVKNHRFSRSELDKITDYVTKELKAAGLIFIRWKEDGSLDSSIAKFLGTDFFEQAQKHIHDLTKNDTLFIVAGDYKDAWTTLGQLRLTLGKQLNLIDTSKHHMFWIIDFPLFEWNKEENRWDSAHHPFTQPQQGWEKQDVKDMKARAYDLVCNGEELGGGSIRIHNPEEQQKVFDLIGIPPEKAKTKFGFLLEAQTFGYPPDGGIAFGIDRLIMMLGNTESIRDVFAFPKTQKGTCLMMQTPSEVDENQLKDVYIKSTYIPKIKEG